MSQDYCENCGVTLQGDFCHVCGQTKQSSARFFGSILMDLLDNLFSYDSRVYRTLVPLMLKPGFVCSEYLSGKRARYLPPFRLYLFASIMFFLLIPFVNDIAISFEGRDEQVADLEEVAENVSGFVTLEKYGDSVKVPGVKEEHSINNLGIPYFIEEQKILIDKLDNLKNANTDELLETTLNSLPTLMFFLLPLLALTLKLFYLFSKRYYMEHLIVVLYSQSFIFFMLLFGNTLEKGHTFLLNAFPSWIFVHTVLVIPVTLSYLWIPAYVFLFLKKVYAQSTALTLLKFSAISLIYLTLIATAVVITITWGIFNL